MRVSLLSIKVAATSMIVLYSGNETMRRAYDERATPIVYSLRKFKGAGAAEARMSVPGVWYRAQCRAARGLHADFKGNFMNTIF